jgi:hypothetical protein
VLEVTAAAKTQLSRQVAHWTVAVTELEDLTRLAAPTGWQQLERYLGLALKRTLGDCVDRLTRQTAVLRAELAAAETEAELDRLRVEIVAFRQRYMAAETMLDFYADGINTRTNDKVGAYLRACDVLASRSMEQVLTPLGHRTPPVLTYVDKGLGASILKAGLRLWDGRTISPVAAIKIVRHNLQRPTALLHEAGHQLAHILGWNDELASVLRRGLARHPQGLGAVWASWASEIAADAFAFAHTGYAAVATLCDVLAGGQDWVLRWLEGDPHPVSYLRILLGKQMCTRHHGAGPWDALGREWIRSYPVAGAIGENAEMIRASLPLLPEIVELIFDTNMSAFGRRSLSAVIDPARVRPDALAELERVAGGGLFTSDHWIHKECLRLLALCGLRVSAEPDGAVAMLKQQESWMLRLGALAVTT